MMTDATELALLRSVALAAEGVALAMEPNLCYDAECSDRECLTLRDLREALEKAGYKL